MTRRVFDARLIHHRVLRLIERLFRTSAKNVRSHLVSFKNDYVPDKYFLNGISIRNLQFPIILIPMKFIRHASFIRAS